MSTSVWVPALTLLSVFASVTAYLPSHWSAHHGLHLLALPAAARARLALPSLESPLSRPLGLRTSPLRALCTCPVGSHPALHTSVCWFTAHPRRGFVSDHGSFVPVPPASISGRERNVQNDNRKETPHLPGKASRPGAFLPDAR